jgi:hypothetical protein
MVSSTPINRGDGIGIEQPPLPAVVSYQLSHLKLRRK